MSVESLHIRRRVIHPAPVHVIARHKANAELAREPSIADHNAVARCESVPLCLRAMHARAAADIAMAHY